MQPAPARPVRSAIEPQLLVADGPHMQDHPVPAEYRMSRVIGDKLPPTKVAPNEVCELSAKVLEKVPSYPPIKVEHLRPVSEGATSTENEVFPETVGSSADRASGFLCSNCGMRSNSVLRLHVRESQVFKLVNPDKYVPRLPIIDESADEVSPESSGSRSTRSMQAMHFCVSCQSNEELAGEELASEDFASEDAASEEYASEELTGEDAAS